MCGDVVTSKRPILEIVWTVSLINLNRFWKGIWLNRIGLQSERSLGFPAPSDSAHSNSSPVYKWAACFQTSVYVAQRQYYHPSEKTNKQKRNSNWSVIYELNFRCGWLNLSWQVGEYVGGAAPDVSRLCLRVGDVFRRPTSWRVWIFLMPSADGNKSMRCSAHLPCQAKPTQATNDRAKVLFHAWRGRDVEWSRSTTLKSHMDTRLGSHA